MGHYKTGERFSGAPPSIDPFHLLTLPLEDSVKSKPSQAILYCQMGLDTFKIPYSRFLKKEIEGGIYVLLAHEIGT